MLMVFKTNPLLFQSLFLFSRPSKGIPRSNSPILVYYTMARTTRVFVCMQCPPNLPYVLNPQYLRNLPIRCNPPHGYSFHKRVNLLKQSIHKGKYIPPNPAITLAPFLAILLQGSVLLPHSPQLHD